MSELDINNKSNYREPLPYEEALGIFLVNPDLFKQNKHTLPAGLFEELGWLYKIMLTVDTEEGMTFKGVANRLQLNQIKIMHDLRATYITEHRLPSLLKQMKDNSLTHQVRGIAKEILESDETNGSEMVRNLQEKAFSLYTSETEDIQNPEKDVDEWADYIMGIAEDPSKAYGMMTGIEELDTITTGLHRQDFSVVGAWTSIGKTAFMLEIVLRLNQAGYKVGVFSLEMIKRQMYNRMMANMLQVSFKKFKTGRLPPASYESMQARKNELKSIYVDDTRGISADYIADNMRRLKRKQGLDFVVVDYIQDVKEKGESNDNGGSAIARVCRKLRAAAQECDCHVMGLSQVVRASQDRANKRLGNNDLAGSTGIETSADVIALLYREDYYDPNTTTPNVLEVNFTKQRNGELGKAELYFDREQQRISSLYGRH